MRKVMTKKQAGSLGGTSTVKRYGKAYMQSIGKKGADAFHKKYRLSPIGLANYAIVNRETNEIVNTTNSSLW